MNFGLYFHIPFCIKKCKYCDFLSFNYSEVSLNDKKSYFDALFKEWELKSSLISPNDVVDSIYIGGGTPSVVEAEYIQEIINRIKIKTNIAENAEITIEVNPGTVTLDKLNKYYLCGINRLSIGVQSTQNRLLKSLGRIHNVNECENTIFLAKKAGFSNISCDLIFAIPQIENEKGQTLKEFIDDINNVLQWGATHISAYSLIIEEDTPLFDLFEHKKAFEIDAETERKMYYLLPDLLKKYNMFRYEISNYGKNNTQSKHNLRYWRCLPYIGFGLGAASYYPLNKEESKSDYIRESNTRDFKNYLNLDFNGDKEILSLKEQMKEYMMLGFRCVSGPDRKSFIDRFGKDYIDIFNKELNKLISKGLITVDYSAKLTDKGLDFANEVFREFV